MIKRILEGALLAAASNYPVVTLTGPRQSGKTTTVRALWPEKTYLSLEDPDVLAFAIDDPRGFLERGGEQGLIIDEAQRHPPLFNYLQGYADRSPPGRYVLSGSNNFLLMEKISQSLAGRTAVLVLLPFSAAEIAEQTRNSTWEESAWSGFYPRVRTGGLAADVFARDYITTYVERDVHTVKNIGDASVFRRFVRLCAGRAGQLLNVSSLASDAGIAVGTAKAWLALLETAWLVTLLQPWHENLNKRVVRSPKLYWYDTSLLCSLLDIRKPDDLAFHPLKGASSRISSSPSASRLPAIAGGSRNCIFGETARGAKSISSRVRAIPVGSWNARRVHGRERLVQASRIFGAATGIEAENRLLVYGGEESYSRSGARVLGWREAALEESDHLAW